MFHHTNIGIGQTNSIWSCPVSVEKCFSLMWCQDIVVFQLLFLPLASFANVPKQKEYKKLYFIPLWPCTKSYWWIVLYHLSLIIGSWQHSEWRQKNTMDFTRNNKMMECKYLWPITWIREPAHMKLSKFIYSIAQKGLYAVANTHIFSLCQTLTAQTLYNKFKGKPASLIWPRVMKRK